MTTYRVDNHQPQNIYRDARALRLVTVVSDTIAQCPNPRPRSCDQAYAWLVAQRWHAAQHELCPAASATAPDAPARDTGR